MPARKVSLDSNKREPVKKPGLASLMPDKTPKGVEERKKAVKRMFKDSPQKTSPLKRTKKTVVEAAAKKPAKVAATKKAPATATKVSPQSAVKKPAVRVRTRTKPQNGIVIEANVDQPDVVVLPSRVSVRAQEKVLAILSILTKDFKQSAERVSYVAGFCFVVFGAYMALSFSGALPQVLTPQVAQLQTSGTNLNTVTTTTDATVSRAFPKPTFSLLDPLPPVIDSISKHTIEVTNARLDDVRLYSLASGETFDVVSEGVVDNTFRLAIDPDALVPARYVLKVSLRSIHDDSKYVFKVGEFEIKEPVDILIEESPNTSPPPMAGTNSSPTPPVAKTVKPTEATTTQDTSLEKEVVPVVEEKKQETLTIKTIDTILRGRTIISMTAPAGARTVELYVRPLKSSTKRFIGLAEKFSGGWQYFFDTTNVPNGEYEIVARSKVDGKFIEASSNRITIGNFVASPAMPENPTPEAVEAIEPEIKIDPNNARSFSDISLNSVTVEAEIKETASSTPYETATNIDSIVGQYRPELEDILKRYAVAKQSENPLMLELVEQELQKIRNEMVQGVLLDPMLNDLGDDIDTVLTERFTDIKRRVDTFEELRRTATERASALDRDGDGISDFDETNLYQTDPDKSDTDTDGVTDGIEIMRGFDPLDPVAEVVVTYEMPQDTVGLIEDDLLKISGVSPVVKTDDPTIAPIVQAEIKGKGLPNSFVTIYVFSTPTIVTVRTGEDGSFAYTFEKELEDGEHEVYVAVTDNTGAIMARSNPFRFIKQAEAFSPIGGAATARTDNSLTGIQMFGSFNVAIGLGILALGMILLMLGATLKERQGFLMTSPKNDVATR